MGVKDFIPQEGITKTNARAEEIKKAEEKRTNIEKAKGFINIGDLSFEKGKYEKASIHYQVAMKTASADVKIKRKIIKTLDNTNKGSIKTFKGHIGGVMSVTFSPDARLAISRSYDDDLKLWSISESYNK